MTRKECKALVSHIFEKGIDGGSSDTYAAIIPSLMYAVNAGMENMSASDLLDVLKKLSKKWQKEIDIATGA